jgi:hypothetical protein
MARLNHIRLMQTGCPPSLGGRRMLKLYTTVQAWDVMGVTLAAESRNGKFIGLADVYR